MKAFNPVRLVKSLQLREDEQQDALECALYQRLNALRSHISRFSKLFMDHLDSEFQKQDEPALRSLLSDQVSYGISSATLHEYSHEQFKGRLVDGILCSSCDRRSDKESEFSELQITLAVRSPKPVVRAFHSTPISRIRQNSKIGLQTY